jgi:hypothetical protein
MHEFAVSPWGDLLASAGWDGTVRAKAQGKITRRGSLNMFPAEVITSNATQLFRKVFLPADWRASVSPEYGRSSLCH